jgi:hypothetical protein
MTRSSPFDLAEGSSLLLSTRIERLGPSPGLNEFEECRYQITLVGFQGILSLRPSTSKLSHLSLALHHVTVHVQQLTINSTSPSFTSGVAVTFRASMALAAFLSLSLVILFRSSSTTASSSLPDYQYEITVRHNSQRTLGV